MYVRECPRCKLEVNEHRRRATLTICDRCGLVASMSEINLRADPPVG